MRVAVLALWLIAAPVAHAGPPTEAQVHSKLNHASEQAFTPVDLAAALGVPVGAITGPMPLLARNAHQLRLPDGAEVDLVVGPSDWGPNVLLLPRSPVTLRARKLRPGAGVVLECELYLRRPADAGATIELRSDASETPVWTFTRPGEVATWVRARIHNGEPAIARNRHVSFSLTGLDHAELLRRPATCQVFGYATTGATP
jgi:hypothetical protein